MNFIELQEETGDLIEVWGYANTLRQPNIPKLVNRAYVDICLASDVIRGPEVMFQTASGQREYIVGGLSSTAYFITTPGSESTQGANTWPNLKGALCTQEMKSFLDATMLNGPSRLKQQDENWVRRNDPLWLMDNTTVPGYIWSPRPNVISLFPAPDAVYTVILYNVMGPVPLVNDNDIPVFWETFHTAIPLRAAYLHSKKYAKGEGREVLAAHDSEYEQLIAELKQLEMEDSGMDTPRVVQYPEPDRIFL